MSHNEHEIPALKNYSASLSVDAPSIKTLNTYGEYIDEDKSEVFLPKNEKYKRFKTHKTSRKPLRNKNNPCRALWIQSAIHNKGIVVPCCYNYSNKFGFGDLMNNSFKDK